MQKFGCQIGPNILTVSGSLDQSLDLILLFILNVLDLQY